MSTSTDPFHFSDAASHGTKSFQIEELVLWLAHFGFHSSFRTVSRRLLCAGAPIVCAGTMHPALYKVCIITLNVDTDVLSCAGAARETHEDHAGRLPQGEGEGHAQEEGGSAGGPLLVMLWTFREWKWRDAVCGMR